MTISPRIQAALKKVDVAHAELFAALEDEARRKRPGGNGRRRNGPQDVPSVERGGVPKRHPGSLA